MVMSSFIPWPPYPPGKHTLAPTEQYLDMSHSRFAGFGGENMFSLRVRIFLYQFISTSPW